MGCVVGFLLVLGISQLWEWLWIWWLRPKTRALRYDLVLLRGSPEDLEQLLRYVRLTSESKELLIVDDGLEGEAKNFCRQLCAMEPQLHFLNSEEAKMLIFPENNLERMAKK